MHIRIDADGCPVVKIAIEIALSFAIDVKIYADYTHVFYEEKHVQVCLCDKGKDSVDFAILKQVEPYDIVITQDYGLASLLLAKHVHVISQNGLLYTSKNMEQLLEQRHMSAKLRKIDKHSGHMKKRTVQDDQAFIDAFYKLCEEVIDG